MSTELNTREVIKLQAKLIALFTKQYKPIGITFIIVFSVLSFLFVAQNEHDILNLRQRLAINQKVLVDTRQSIVIKELDDIFSNINFLYESPNFQAYLSDESKKSLVESEWSALASNKKKYDQFRYIDIKGNERIRINFKNGKASASKVADLQNKSERDYFKDTINLNRGDIYVSKFDLNLESGALELPLKPMLRVALPVFDKNHKKRGIIIANYLASFILEDIKNANRKDKYVHLVNKDAYWLAAPDSKNEWAFMYPDRSDISFKTQYPTEWKLVTTEKTGQFFTANGLFTIRTIYPTEQIYFSSDENEHVLNYDNQDSMLFLILQIPASEEPYANNTSRYILAMLNLLHSVPVVLGLLMLSLLVAILFGMHIDETEKIKKLATTDALTGCINRMQGMNIVESEMLRSKRYKTPLTLILLDLDHFKKINDTWGHPVGDQVLKLVAESIRKNIRSSDSLIRLGGEEFIIFAPETNITEAALLAEKIRKVLAETNHPTVGKVTVSLGVAEHIQPESFNQWYIRTDAALYEAKNSGRNRVVQAKAPL